MKTIIAWFVDNPIAAFLSFFSIIVFGVHGYFIINKELIPPVETNFIVVDASYPGAAPTEVEQHVVIRIEEAISNIKGIKRVTSEATNGHANILIEVSKGDSVDSVMRDVKNRVDEISSFPQSMDKPVIKHKSRRNTLMYVALSGDIDIDVLKKYAYQIQDEMQLLEGVSEVIINGLPDSEVSIEISRNTLQKYNIKMEDIANAIAASSVNIPAGLIKSESGNISIQSRSQAHKESDFSKIPVIVSTTGKVVTLGEIASVHNGVKDDDLLFMINDKIGLNLEVKISDDPKLFEGTKNAQEYIKNLKNYFPDGLKLEITFEMKSLYDERMALLEDNAFSGMVMVCIVLLLFMSPSIALLVSASMFAILCGAFWVLPYFDISLNFLSMFAFIIVLGIVVDDSVVICDSFYSNYVESGSARDSAILAASSMAKPLILAALTTTLFFLPLIDVPPALEPLTISTFYAITCCLIFSILISIFILPALLSHLCKKQYNENHKPESKPFSKYLIKIYSKLLSRTISNSFLTISASFLILSLAATAYLNGWVNTVFWPNIPQSYINIEVTLPEDFPFKKTEEISNKLINAVKHLKDNHELNEKNQNRPFIREYNKTVTNSHINVFVGLTSSEDRNISTEEVGEKLRELVPTIPESLNYSLSASYSGNEPDIALDISITNGSVEDLNNALMDIQSELIKDPGIDYVANGMTGQSKEILLEIKPLAVAIGLNLGSISQQVRSAYYGLEVQRIPTPKEDIRVMLRYPKSERDDLSNLANLLITTDDGGAIPLHSVASLRLVDSASSIKRVNSLRNIALNANVKSGYNPEQIVKNFLQKNEFIWKQK